MISNELYVFMQIGSSNQRYTCKTPLDSKIIAIVEIFKKESKTDPIQIQFKETSTSVDLQKSLRDYGFNAHEAIELSSSPDQQAVMISRLNDCKPFCVEIADQHNYHLDARCFKTIGDVKKYVFSHSGIAEQDQIASNGKLSLSDDTEIQDLAIPKLLILQRNEIHTITVRCSKTLGGKEIALEVYKTDTVADAKHDLLNILKRDDVIPHDAVESDYALIYDSNCLDSCQPVKEFLRNEVPKLLLEKTMTVFINDIVSLRRSLQLSRFSTIEQLKLAISKKVNVSPDEFYMTFAGKRLTSDRMLIDYNINNESILRMTKRLRPNQSVYKGYLQDKWALPIKNFPPSASKKEVEPFDDLVGVCIDEQSMERFKDVLPQIRRLFMVVIDLKQTSSVEPVEKLAEVILQKPSVVNIELRGNFFYQNPNIMYKFLNNPNLVSLITPNQFILEPNQTSFDVTQSLFLPKQHEEPPKISISQNLVDMSFSPGSKSEIINKLMTNRENAKAFLEACKLDNIFLVSEQLEKGISPNMFDGNGNTALHYSALGGALETSELLLKYGANKLVPNKDELLPEHLASLSMHPTTQAFIRGFE